MSTTAPQGNNVQVPEQLLSGVLADAAERAGTEPGSVVVVSGEAVDWADGSLGCPAPGIDYIQVITPGYRVVVDAGGTSLEYHLNQRGDFKQCTGGTFYPPSDY